jgi:hypothetical protein
MLGAKTLSLCALVATAVATATGAPAYQYKFDAASAAGVDGTIRVQYDSDSSSKAKISADLDFSKVVLSEITKFDGNCTSEIVEYKWHIHVKWPSATKQSDKLGQCSKALTGNHYDPTKACGPNSEFAETPECDTKIATYACNPGNYTANPAVCEKGDLSGKFGGLKLDKDKKVKMQWVDNNYPLPSENTAQWNMILHGVCGKMTPRIACAVGLPDRPQC